MASRQSFLTPGEYLPASRKLDGYAFSLHAICLLRPRLIAAFDVTRDLLGDIRADCFRSALFIDVSIDTLRFI